MKILFYSIHEFEKKFVNEAFKGVEITLIEDRLTLKTVDLSKGYEGIAVFSSDVLDKKVLEALYKYGIKYISTRSVGYDHIDVESAEKLNIKVANVPEYSPYSVAEFTVAMLLSVNRKLIKANNLFKSRDFRLDSLVGFDVNGKTIGIIGCGKIGSVFANIMLAFGTQVLIYDLEINEKLNSNKNVKYVDLDFLYENSDIISISIPLNTHTKYLINKHSIAKMKRKPIILNTARGGVVNTNDLIEALKSGQISAAALDVFEREKGMYFHDFTNKEIKDDEFNTLNSLENVYLTSHQAFLTNEALSGIANTTALNFESWRDKGFCQNELSS